MTYTPNLSYGNRATHFGSQDYFHALKEIWDANQPGRDRQRLLADRRQDVLSWMADPANVEQIDPTNRLGVAGGMGERISSGNLTHMFQGSAGSESKNWIGHADLMAGRAAGHSWGDIQSYLDSNQNLLRAANVPGGGGLYDQVRTEARIADMGQHYTQQNDVFADAIESMTSSLGDMTTQQTDFQQAQLDWQAGESAAQREHEAAMLAEQRKVRTATPTHVKNPVSQLAIGPGKVAAPQSASSLARKRLGSAPLVTGLNIGNRQTSRNIR